MTVFQSLKQSLVTSSLTKEEYKHIIPIVTKDNRDKLITATAISTGFLFFMFLLSLRMESISHSRTVYLIGITASVLIHLIVRLSVHVRLLTAIGMYLFISALLIFGIVQSVCTAPQEQTTSFIVLLLVLPVWFNDRPICMIPFIYLFTALFIVAVFQFKTGYVLEADLVNVTVYSTISVIMSTYTTCIKCRRHYMEYHSDLMSKVDVLTGLGNRHAFTELSARYTDNELPEQFTLFCMDLNELKPTNDTMGHHVGDELLCGTAECIRSTFDQYGSSYRTGGDEFIVVLELPPEKLAELSQTFERTVAAWTGPSGIPLHISCGYASAYEIQDATLLNVSKLADHRLYEAKAEYYRTTGHERRGQR